MPEELSRRAFGQVVAAAAVGVPMLQTDKAAGDLFYLSARELVGLMRRKQVSARDVMAAHLARIERVNPTVNAIVTLVAERAMAEAARADEAFARGGPTGVLHGLPVAHKDLLDTAGIRTTRGSPFYRDQVPTRDAQLVARIRGAGALTLGKTNTPEFGAGSQTFNTVFGATRNPYDTTRTCGGSSGGAAVALACGMVPIADGSDTGGSLRNPAAFCNVVGFRPSPGRVPREVASWSPLSVAGPMARSVGDVALFFSAIAGPHPRSPLSIAEDGARFGASLGRDFKGTRVAWWRGLGGIPFEPDIVQAVAANRRVFEDLGCVVEEAEPDFDGVDEAFATLRFTGNHASYAPLVRERPEWVKDTITYEVARGARAFGARGAPRYARRRARRYAPRGGALATLVWGASAFRPTGAAPSARGPARSRSPEGMEVAMPLAWPNSPGITRWSRGNARTIFTFGCMA